MSEKNVHLAVVNYLKMQYPKVLFRSDTGAGMKLTIGQAKAQKAIQNGMAWPDLFIAEPKRIWHGMFIELKDEGIRLRNKGGFFASTHLAEQDYCHRELITCGYFAIFACGFNEAKELIDKYLSGKL